VKIFHVSSDRGIAPGGSKGASVHLSCIAGALASEGHEVITFCSRELVGDTPFPVPLRRLQDASTLIREAERGGAPDAIYQRYSLGDRSGLEAARALKCPLVLEVNAPLCEETRLYRPHRLGEDDPAIERELFREADLIAVVSEPLRGYVAEIRGGDEGIVVIPNGCDPDLYPAQPGPRDSEKPQLVFLGNPKPWHGADILPGLVADLVAAGRDVTCLIIGGGRGANTICDRASELGVRKHFQVTGEISHQRAAQQLAGGTLLLAPYPVQPLFYFCPLKVIEGMAAGVPVVATDQGDISRLLGGTGVLVPPGDDRAFFDAVSGLLDDEARRLDLATRARARAHQGLTWRHHARTLVEKIASHSQEVAR